MTYSPHDVPRRPEPVSEAQFRAELANTLRRAGIDRPFTLTFADHVSARHARDPRAYAEVHTDSLGFAFAHEAKTLPDENRLALIAHEVGHVVDPLATENGADRAAERALGIRIVYDPRWPGKGLQRLALRSENPASRDHKFWATCEMLSPYPRAYEVMQFITSNQKPITYPTFARKADLSELRAMDHPSLYRISSPSNWAISFHKSRTPSGIPVYYYRWSGIEHMFTPDEPDMNNEARALGFTTDGVNPDFVELNPKGPLELEVDVTYGADHTWHFGVFRTDTDAYCGGGSGFDSPDEARRWGWAWAQTYATWHQSPGQGSIVTARTKQPPKRLGPYRTASNPIHKDLKRKLMR